MGTHVLIDARVRSTGRSELSGHRVFLIFSLVKLRSSVRNPEAIYIQN